jgi:predicted secreted hydrolase
MNPKRESGWNRRRSAFLFVLVAVVLCFPRPSGTRQPDAESYRSVTGSCGLEFPSDHGAHPDFRTEWWYYTGNLFSDRNEPFGFQLTFFRHRFVPPAEDENRPENASRWRARDLFFAHAALTNGAAGRFLYDERTSRGVLGLAGAEWNGETLRIHLNDWSAVIEGNRHRLTAASEDFALELELFAEKPPALHGDRGVSLKGGTPERASCYYSLTRLRAEGSIDCRGRRIPVSGTAWMDHEFSSAALEPGLVGWDWFGLQLNDRTELMIYLLRKADGRFHPASSGSFVDVSGNVRHLERDHIRVEVLSTWKSPRSGAVYPIRRRLRIPELSMDLELNPRLSDQELETTESTGVTYWEGSVTVTGISRGAPVSGTGYMELTGYAEPLDAPL